MPRCSVISHLQVHAIGAEAAGPVDAPPSPHAALQFSRHRSCIEIRVRRTYEAQRRGLELDSLLAAGRLDELACSRDRAARGDAAVTDEVVARHRVVDDDLQARHAGAVVNLDECKRLLRPQRAHPPLDLDLPACLRHALLLAFLRTVNG